MSLEEFYQEGEALVSLIGEFARLHHVAAIAQADHIGYKCDSKDSYERMRALLEPESVFVYQSYISGRRIAVLRLKRAFETALGPISVLELADQKPDGSQRNRFDHIEIYAKDLAYDGFVKQLEAGGVTLTKIERPHHTTYDIELSDGYNIKLTQGRLIEKIKQKEMLP